MNSIFKANSDIPLDNRALSGSNKTNDGFIESTSDFAILRQFIEEKARPEEVYSNQNIESLDVDALLDDLSQALEQKQTTPIEEAEILLSRLSESASALQKQLAEDNTSVIIELDEHEFSPSLQDGKALPPNAVLTDKSVSILPVSEEYLFTALSQKAWDASSESDEAIGIPPPSAFLTSDLLMTNITGAEKNQYLQTFSHVSLKLLDEGLTEGKLITIEDNQDVPVKSRLASTVEMALKPESELLKTRENVMVQVDEGTEHKALNVDSKASLIANQNINPSGDTAFDLLTSLDLEQDISSLQEGISKKKQLSFANQSGDAPTTTVNKHPSFELGNNASLTGLSQLPSKAEQALVQQQRPLSLSTNIDQAGEALTERVIVMMSKNLKHVDIRLDPPELGKMQIKLALNQDQASVQIIVANQAVREIVEQTMPRLREMMQQQGLQLGQASVEQHSPQSGQGSSGQSGQDQSGNSSSVHANAKHDTDSESIFRFQEDQAQSLVNYSVLPKGRVDYYA